MNSSVKKPKCHSECTSFRVTFFMLESVKSDSFFEISPKVIVLLKLTCYNT